MDARIMVTAAQVKLGPVYHRRRNRAMASLTLPTSRAGC
jgi:hypothetical protein